MDDYNVLNEKYEYLTERFEELKNETNSSIDKLLSEIINMQNDIDCIKRDIEKLRVGKRSHEELDAFHDKIDPYFDYVDSLGLNNFIGKSTSEVAGNIQMWFQLQKGETITLTQGNKSAITGHVKKRYGLGTKGGYFCAIDGGAA